MEKFSNFKANYWIFKNLIKVYSQNILYQKIMVNMIGNLLTMHPVTLTTQDSVKLNDYIKGSGIEDMNG